MILSKTSNNTWTPTAGGTGTFIGTLAAFNAIKDTLPVNTVAYITDDGNGDLQPVDAVTNGDMHPVTSNAVYDKFASIAAVDSVTNGNMHPVTSNAVYDAITERISIGQMPLPTLNPSGLNPDIVYTDNEVTIAGKNIGKLGSNRIHFAWTTNGYLALCVDTTVVAAIKGGTVIY